MHKRIFRKVYGKTRPVFYYCMFTPQQSKKIKIGNKANSSHRMAPRLAALALALGALAPAAALSSTALSAAVMAAPSDHAHHRAHPRAPRHAPISALDAGSDALATGLGYLVGAGSLLLYAPIGARLARTRSADGLTLSTWWLKLASYTASDVYAHAAGYPISTYVETLIVTVEAAALLLAVAALQGRLATPQFAGLALLYAAALGWALAAAPPEALSLGQAAATLLNTGALVPQLALNARRRAAGDYSPLTASLACAGCAIRLFTTLQLSGGDPLLLAGFGSGLALNGALLGQVVYFGTVVERRSLGAVLCADFHGGGPSRRAGGGALVPTRGPDETSDSD
jgi:mannose-P-dolichol utilization defect protein 1